MIYTYQISFNGVDYVALYPTLPLEMSGEWVTDTFIWREKIKELKINKNLNSTVFDTLKSYFTDSTKFETKIYIKILKNSVQESLHWFGIKWGEIDYDLTYYSVSPELQDNYSIYILPFLNIPWEPVAIDDVDIQLVNQAAANYPFVYSLNTTRPGMLLETFIKDMFNSITGFAKADIVSSIMFGNNYEDTTPVTVTNGLIIDYVTSSYSVFKYACINADTKTLNDINIKSVFELLTLWQIYPYFDTNGKLRLEHISFYIDKLVSNAVSTTIQDYMDNFRYENSDLITYEELQMFSGGELDVADDWYKLPITYSVIRNRIDSTEKIYSLNKWYTNADFYYQNVASISSYFMIIAGYRNLVMNWQNGNMTAFSSGSHYLALTHLTNEHCGSMNFKANTQNNLTVVATTFTGQLTFGIWRRGGVLSSNEIVVTTTGTTTGVFIITDPGESDYYLKCTSDSNGSFGGYVLLEDASDIMYINPWKVGAKSAGNIMNGHFSKANILNDYWKDYRAALKGTMNGSAETFTSTKYNLKRKIFKALASVPNPMFGVNDGTKIGRINSWTRSLDTGYMELELNYQEIA